MYFLNLRVNGSNSIIDSMLWLAHLRSRGTIGSFNCDWFGVVPEAVEAMHSERQQEHVLVILGIGEKQKKEEKHLDLA